MSLRVAITHQLGDFCLNVRFDAPNGITALFGPSGAGKTSVLNAIAGLLRPGSAHISLDDTVLHDERHFAPPHLRKIGYVFQNARLFPHLNVAKNLSFARRYARGRGGVSYDDVIGLLGLDRLLDRRPATLSGGEARRVAIGRALLAQPRLLLMDEPMAGLDAPRKAEILPYLDALKAHAGLPIIYVSHAMDEVARLADTLVLMRDGQVCAFGTLQAMLADPQTTELIGVREAGAVLEGIVETSDPGGLMCVNVGQTQLWLPGALYPPFSKLRIRILAQDVILALEKPTGISALNIMPVRITRVQMGVGPGAMVLLDMGGAELLARVTARSVTALQLHAGLECYAILKSTSVSPMSVARSP